MSEPTFPTGASAVDVLRPSGPGLQVTTVNGLRLWARSNNLDDADLARLPLTVDWKNQTITLAATAEEPARNVPMVKVIRGALWRALVDEGGVWCADPDHDDPVGRHCPEQVDHRGEHTPAGGRPAWLGPPLQWDGVPPPPAPAGGWRPSPWPRREQLPAPAIQPGGPVDLLFTAAIARAGGRCQHPDPGQPIYESDRACANCAAAAVLELFSDAHTIHLLRTALGGPA
jgi:hypothetical protein